MGVSAAWPLAGRQGFELGWSPQVPTRTELSVRGLRLGWGPALPSQCGFHHDCSLLSQDAAILRTAFQLLNSKLDSELRPEQSLARLS